MSGTKLSFPDKAATTSTWSWVMSCPVTKWSNSLRTCRLSGVRTHPDGNAGNRKDRSRCAHVVRKDTPKLKRQDKDT